MKILATGAGGQIGQELVGALAAAGHDVVATDIEPARMSLPAGVGRDFLDVTDAAAVRDAVAEHRPEIVYHLAAILSAKGETQPQRTYQINQNGTFHVLEACRLLGVRQVMYTSTIAVYGAGVPDPTPDDVALAPTTMYGITKVGGELLCRYYWQRYGLDCRGVRFPGIISASLPGGGTSDYALFMYYAGVLHGAYEAFCRPDTRIPLMYMPDAIRALTDLAAAPRETLRRCIYNVTAFSPTAEQIADAVRGAVPNVAITFAPDPARQAILDSWPRALDDSLARDDWGWAPEHDLASMTADLVPRVRELVEHSAFAH